MALRLRVVSNHAKLLGDSSTRVFGVHGGTIGRAGDNDWVLPDPERYISGKHARIDYRAGVYWLTDTSSNGTYVNEANEPQSASGSRQLKDGDRVRMGDYDLVVSIDAANDFPPDKSAIVAYDGVVPLSSVRQSTENDIGASLNLDALLATEDSAARPIKPVNAYGQAVEPPRASAAKSRGAPAKAPARAAAAPPAETPWNLATRRIEPYRNPQRPASGEAASAASAEPQVSQASQSPRAESAPTPDQTAALQMLCRGAGIDLANIPLNVQPQMLVLAGQILREALFGLMDVLQVRTELRNRFRIAQTTIQPSDNNALNFSTGVDEALRRLFEQRGNRYLGPVDTVRETFRELKLHHQAMVAALETAFGEFLARLEPSDLQERFDRGLKRGGLLASANKSKYWELYKELFQSLGPTPHGDLPHVFIEDFARAYEARLAELNARVPRPGEKVPAAS
jgi:type VI secretion system FHA domain protein